MLKKEKDKLIEERIILYKKIKDKKDVLDLIKPFNQIKEDAEGELRLIRKENAEMLEEIVLLEREIRRFHKIK